MAQPQPRKKVVLTINVSGDTVSIIGTVSEKDLLWLETKKDKENSSPKYISINTLDNICGVSLWEDK